MVQSIAATQEARNRVRITSRASKQKQSPQDSIEEEARKEELRRFVREKWKRIRELESQSSPGMSTEGEEDSPSRAKVIKQSERRGSRASSVEYDPENPFDDDKKRNQIQTSETRKVCAPINKSASGYTDSRLTSSDSSLRQKNASSVKNSKERDIARTGLEKQSTKVAEKAFRLIERHERSAANTSDATKKASVVSISDAASEKAADLSPKKRRIPQNKVSSTEPVVTKSSSQENALRLKGEETERAIPNAKSLTDVVARQKVNQEQVKESDWEKQGDVLKKKDDDTPTRRRKRRSEVPHYQPSAVVSLSTDTSNALAELEASLSRLKAHSGKASSARRKNRSPLSSPKQYEAKSTEEPLRSRRSLSPAKEMRQMQLELEKTRGDQELSPPRVSFLQRMEQNRAEIASSSSLSPVEAHKDSKAFPEKDVIKGQENRVEPKKKVKRYSYTPTQRQPEPGTVNNGVELGDESSCSIVIGDESIDEMIRLRKSSKFLSNLRVFVDVRDQDGEDASSGWIEKLKSVGAKVYSKIPSSSNDQGKSKLTHIVYKNGRPSTLHYLRSMTSNPSGPAPPIVVGVNWILESLQQGIKIDERDYLVEVGKQAIFNKPRTSMTSKRAPQSTFHRSSSHNLAELLAKKKTIQNAPAQPSPLARRCWNMDASTSSSISATTSYNPNEG